MSGTVVHIESLGLNGFSEDEARRAAVAFEARLGELLNHHGLPEGVHPADLAAIDLGNLPQSATTPEGIGQELARMLFGRIWQ